MGLWNHEVTVYSENLCALNRWIIGVGFLWTYSKINVAITLREGKVCRRLPNKILGGEKSVGQKLINM